MAQDALDHGALLDSGNQAQPAAALIAGKNVDRDRAPSRCIQRFRKPSGSEDGCRHYGDAIPATVSLCAAVDHHGIQQIVADLFT